MRALVLDRPGSFRVADVPDPAPRPTEVVVKVDCCGICGTDLHILAGEFPAEAVPAHPRPRVRRARRGPRQPT